MSLDYEYWMEIYGPYVKQLFTILTSYFEDCDYDRFCKFIFSNSNLNKNLYLIKNEFI